MFKHLPAHGEQGHVFQILVGDAYVVHLQDLDFSPVPVADEFHSDFDFHVLLSFLGGFAAALRLSVSFNLVGDFRIPQPQKRPNDFAGFVGGFKDTLQRPADRAVNGCNLVLAIIPDIYWEQIPSISGFAEFVDFHCCSPFRVWAGCPARGG
jgi:hypothetical protein